eukprot:TRINITY_DN45578_c0_g2_i1.p1 TRINITY_DN45578_c0_g2~~TRINITY_DN45578_c0_g2_i1.p1  ORF type:complete len:146 (-),score=14.30 TRINITY_DN45578_c0_g2_i1:69-506(-)
MSADSTTWTGNAMASGSGSTSEAPDESDVPLPFISLEHPTSSAVTTAQGAQTMTAEDAARAGLGQSIDRCVRLLLTSPADEINEFLQDVASILLSEESRTSRMTYLGYHLSDRSKAFLRCRKLGLKAVLLCYLDDFRLLKFESCC